MSNIKSYFPNTQKLADDINRLKKPNPNNWPIVDKWNCKYVCAPNAGELYDAMEEELAKAIENNWQKAIDGFADVENVLAEDTMPKTKSLQVRYEESYATDPNSDETWFLKHLISAVSAGSISERNAKLAHTYFVKAEREEKERPINYMKELKPKPASIIVHNGNTIK